MQNYGDYRDYLADWFQAAKATNARTSFRYVARHLGLKAPNHFHLVINKQRHLSKPTLVRLHRLLRLRPKERAYLDLLHELATARGADERTTLETKLTRLQGELTEMSLPREQYALLTNSVAWHLKMGALRFHDRTGDEIAALVTAACPFPLRAEDVASALALLVNLGAVRVDGGRYSFELDSLKTEWDFDDQQIKQFHRTNLQLAAATIPWPISRRFHSNVTIPCTAEMVDTIKKEIRDLCLRLLEMSNGGVTSAAECQKVMSLQFAMFPYFDFVDPQRGLV